MAEEAHERVAELPPSIARNIWQMNAAMDRWLRERETNHLKPIDPTRVLVRPHTPQERAERARRLQERQQENRRPSAFQLLLEHRVTSNVKRKGLQ